jgi:DNA-binding beta-propeller fold protein YncE
MRLSSLSTLVGSLAQWALLGLVGGGRIYAQAPSWVWAKSAGNAKGHSIAVDAKGNVYVTGYFESDSLTLGSITLRRAGGEDIFVVKYDSNGKVLWARSAGGRNDDYGASIAVDANGNVYVTGYFESDTLTFGPITLRNAFAERKKAILEELHAKDTSLTTLTTLLQKALAGDTSAMDLIEKAFPEDPSFKEPLKDLIQRALAGNSSARDTLAMVLMWSISARGLATQMAEGMSTRDIFIVKYDPNGQPLWATSAGGEDDDEGRSIAVDAKGNVYVTGYFKSANLTFGSITLKNADKGGGEEDIFIAKYDPKGQLLWAKSAGGRREERGEGIAVDPNGNVYVAGYFRSDALSFGSVTLEKDFFAIENIFIVKYDPKGQLLWAKSADGKWSGNSGTNIIAVDPNGNVYVTGYFESSTLSFDSITLKNEGEERDLFVVKYSPNGQVLWAKSIGGKDYESGIGIAVDARGNAYVMGHFCSDRLTIGSTTLRRAANTSIIRKGDMPGELSMRVGDIRIWRKTWDQVICEGDIFIVKYTPNGQVLWAKSASRKGTKSGTGLAVDPSGNVYVTGWFESDELILDTIRLENRGLNSMFVGKLKP